MAFPKTHIEIDTPITFGQWKGKTPRQLFSSPQGMGWLKWLRNARQKDTATWAGDLTLGFDYYTTKVLLGELRPDQLPSHVASVDERADIPYVPEAKVEKQMPAGWGSW